MSVRVSIAGGSGYVGGGLLRLLLAHPHGTVGQVTAERRAGEPIHAAHPNLRGQTDLRFVSTDALAPCDVLILALPHGQAARQIAQYAALAPHIVDCSADFR